VKTRCLTISLLMIASTVGADLDPNQLMQRSEIIRPNPWMEVYAERAAESDARRAARAEARAARTAGPLWFLGWGLAELEAEARRVAFQAGYTERRGGTMRSTWQPDRVRARVSQLNFNNIAARPDLGPADGYADRTYADGYVFMDEGTADPDAFLPGQTWFWGYQNADQYDGASVRFSSGPYTDVRNQALPLTAVSEEERFDQRGVDVAAQYRFWHTRWFAAGMAAGFTGLNEQRTEMEVEQRWDRNTRITRQTVDRYNAPFEPFPAAGHVGTLEGPGYLVNNIPDAREEVEVERRVRTGFVRSELDVEFEMMEVRLGPALWFTPHPRVGLMFTPHLRMAHVRAVATARTLVQPAARAAFVYEDRQRQRDWVTGYGLAGEISALLYGPWRLSVGAGIDWWQDTVTLTADPFETEIELGEWHFTIGVGREW